MILALFVRSRLFMALASNEVHISLFQAVLDAVIEAAGQGMVLYLGLESKLT